MSTLDLDHRAGPPVGTATRTPTDLVLTAALVVGPLLSLLADVLYAVRGWDDPDAGAVHVLAATAYALVLVRLATWARGWLAAATLVAGVGGAIGSAAYGFDAIHVSLGAVSLVDTSGPGAIIKPLGLLLPLALLLGALVLARAHRPGAAALLAVAGAVWPVAHIADIGWLAVAVNVVLVLALVPLALRPVDA